LRPRRLGVRGVVRMGVWCAAGPLDQLVESFVVNRLGPEGLVGATGANRVFDIHRLRIALREAPRARLIPRKGAALRELPEAVERWLAVRSVRPGSAGRCGLCA